MGRPVGISQNMRLQDCWQTEFGDRIWRKKKKRFLISKYLRNIKKMNSEWEKWENGSLVRDRVGTYGVFSQWLRQMERIIKVWDEQGGGAHL